MELDPSDIMLAGRLRSLLLALASEMDELAVAELAATPMWAPSAKAIGRRAAAAALRAEADRLPPFPAGRAGDSGKCPAEQNDQAPEAVAVLTAEVAAPAHEPYLRDMFGTRLRDGACVVDADGEVGYVRLEFGGPTGPDSSSWDGWFSVTRTRDAHPLSGKLSNGGMVQVMGVRS